MMTIADRLPRISGRAWLGFATIATLLLSGTEVRGEAAKPPGDKAAWQKHLDEMAKRTELDRKGGPPRPADPASPGGASPSSSPSAPGAAPPMPALPPAPGGAVPSLELFEDDFDQTSAISYVQHRVVLLVFAPQPETDSWRPDSELQPWAQRVVICPVHEGSLGDRAQRLAKAFGIDPAQGGLLAALVRAPDGVNQLGADQLLYQVLGRYPAPRDAGDVLKVLQEAVAAYEVKKNQYSWEAVLTGTNVRPIASTAAAPFTPIAAASPTPSTSVATATPSPMPSTPAAMPGPPPAPATPKEPPKPAAPIRSPFETAVMKAWQTHRPVMLIFPGTEPFDKKACAAAWKGIPGALAPEFAVLTPGSADGSIDGRSIDWEAFFDVGGQYPHALMILPESEDASANPKVADMSYRIIARRHGALTPDSAAVLARLWMSEDFDAVVMRAWVLRRPLLVVFPHAEHERDLLESAELAKLEERASVYVNTKDAVSGIRHKTAPDVEKEFATQAVERAEVVLIKLESKPKGTTAVRLDQIQLTPVNRAFAKKSPEKILEWTTSRVPARQ